MSAATNPDAVAEGFTGYIADAVTEYIATRDGCPDFLYRIDETHLAYFELEAQEIWVVTVERGEIVGKEHK